MSKIHVRRILVFCAAFAVVACNLGGLAQQLSSEGAPGPQGAAPTVAPDLAQRLASEVVQAQTTEARYQALLDVMKALHVGVRRPDTGEAIVAGAERRPDDFFLYDFEIKALSAALGRKQSWGDSDIAGFLTDVGAATGPNSLPIDAATFRKALLQDMQAAAAAPTDLYSLPLLLVRQLGLLHEQPYDLLKGTPDTPLQFDALQDFLLTTDFAWPALGGRVSFQPGASGSISLTSFHSSLCDGAFGNNAAGPASFGKYIAGLAIGAKWANEAAVWPIVTDMIHGEMLAYSVRVTMLEHDANSITHYGPAGHAPDAGKELRFHLKVDMLDDYGETVVGCGALIGYQIPKQGGIQGVAVNWSTGGLEEYGTVSYDPPDQKTGADGVSTLIFQPKSEVFPGIGKPQSEVNVVMGTALYQSAFGNLPGAIAQYLYPKSDSAAWAVERHIPRGFKFEGLKLHADYSFGATTDWVISGRVCGQDPLAKEWEVDQKWVFNFMGVHTGENKMSWAMALAGSPNTTGGVVNSLGGPGPSGGDPSASSGLSIAAEIIPGPHPTVKATIPSNGVLTFTPGAPVPLEEDTSCPAP